MNMLDKHLDEIFRSTKIGSAYICTYHIHIKLVVPSRWCLFTYYSAFLIINRGTCWPSFICQPQSVLAESSDLAIRTMLVGTSNVQLRSLVGWGIFSSFIVSFFKGVCSGGLNWRWCRDCIIEKAHGCLIRFVTWQFWNTGSNSNDFKKLRCKGQVLPPDDTSVYIRSGLPPVQLIAGAEKWHSKLTEHITSYLYSRFSTLALQVSHWTRWYYLFLPLFTSISFAENVLSHHFVSNSHRMFRILRQLSLVKYHSLQFDTSIQCLAAGACLTGWHHSTGRGPSTAPFMTQR